MLPSSDNFVLQTSTDRFEFKKKFKEVKMVRKIAMYCKCEIGKSKIQQKTTAAMAHSRSKHTDSRILS